MSLTIDDLKSIQSLLITSEKSVTDRIIERFERLERRIDKLDDDLSLQTAQGFEEVHKKISDLDDHISRVERIVVSEVDRVDQQGVAIKRMRKALKAV
jgi:hypothetical protein